MIDVKDLRVGNWVSTGSDDVLDDYDSLYFQIEPKHYDCLTKGMFDYVPIPLTEDILAKCGFEKRTSLDETHYSDNKSLPILLNSNGDYILCDIDIRVVVKYVHELQNLYKALVGVELDVRF
tara:strand:+ start:15 stop:380 length:366 start_codon:yes stop_codon:yes gene_type:complete